jgi:hypothetical protein
MYTLIQPFIRGSFRTISLWLMPTGRAECSVARASVEHIGSRQNRNRTLSLRTVGPLIKPNLAENSGFCPVCYKPQCPPKDACPIHNMALSTPVKLMRYKSLWDQHNIVYRACIFRTISLWLVGPEVAHNPLVVETGARFFVTNHSQPNKPRSLCNETGCPLVESVPIGYISGCLE